MLPNISQSKGNQTMKFGQLIEYDRRNIFSKNYAENEAGRVVPDLLIFLKKLNMRWKQLACSFVSIFCDSPQLVI